MSTMTGEHIAKHGQGTMPNEQYEGEYVMELGRFELPDAVSHISLRLETDEYASPDSRRYYVVHSAYRWASDGPADKPFEPLPGGRQVRHTILGQWVDPEYIEAVKCFGAQTVDITAAQMVDSINASEQYKLDHQMPPGLRVVKDDE